MLKIPSSFYILLFPVIDFATNSSNLIFFFNRENLEELIQTNNQTLLWQTFKKQSGKVTTLLSPVEGPFHAMQAVPVICAHHCDTRSNMHGTACVTTVASASQNKQAIPSPAQMPLGLRHRSHVQPAHREPTCDLNSRQLSTESAVAVPRPSLIQAQGCH